MEGKKILVVDDEKKIRELLELRLSSAGYQVLQAKDGEEGVEMARRYAPDLILMDVMMPKMDGPEAVSHLEEDSRTNEIPVIFLTAIITKEEEESQGAGFQVDASRYQFIAKPFDGEELLEAIEKNLKG